MANIDIKTLKNLVILSCSFLDQPDDIDDSSSFLPSLVSNRVRRGSNMYLRSGRAGLDNMYLRTGRGNNMLLRTGKRSNDNHLFEQDLEYIFPTPTDDRQFAMGKRTNNMLLRTGKRNGGNQMSSFQITNKLH